MRIYLITNTVNGKQYVGQTQHSIDYRWKFHCYASRKAKNNRFHNALRKYDPKCFNIEVLEDIENIELLNEREIYWIAYYDTCNNGYNSNHGGGQNLSLAPESRESISNSLKNNYKNGYIHPRGMLGKIPWNKGKTTPEHVRNKQSISASKRWAK
jgi:group I intron endonuclease